MKKFLALLLTCLMLLASCGPATGNDTTLSNDESNTPETDPPKIERVDYTINVKEDTYVVNSDVDGDQSDNSFFSTDIELNVKTNGDYMSRYSYLKFDISSLAGDNDFTCIELDLMQTRRESNTPEFCAVDVYACDPNVDVNNLTFNKQPEKMAYVASNDKIDTQNITRSFPITDYVRYALEQGQSEIVLCLKDNSSKPHRIRFASLDSGKDIPKLSVYYGTKTDDQKFSGGFGVPRVSEHGLDAILGQYDPEASSIKVLEDAYIEAGESSDLNFGSKDLLSLKGSIEKPTKFYRVILLKFDIEKIPADIEENINLMLYCNYMEAPDVPTTVNLYSFDPYEWEEKSVVYNTISQREGLITSIKVSEKGWVYMDITDYIKECQKNGDKLISFYLEGEQATNKGVRFNSKESGSNLPAIKYSEFGLNFATSVKYEKENPWEVAMENVTTWFKRWEEIKKGGSPDFAKIVKDESEYSILVDAASSEETDGYNTKYTALPTRNISTLKGYKASTAEVAKYDQYGGLMDESMKQEATGFFYVKKIGDRWWNIDPLGYPMFRVSVASVTPPDSQIAKYGDFKLCAQATTDRLRELGFNSFGAWYSIATFIKSENPLNQTRNLGIADEYTTKLGTNKINGQYMSRVIPAFDPDFATFAEGVIQNKISGYKNSSEVYGWMSDNELPRATLALDNALTFDYKDIRYIYSYATAWTFMYLKTGKSDVSLADITDELRYEFRAMMYDKYYSVVAPLIKKYDPNHMYMGSRLHGNNFEEEYIMRVAGYWCDVVTYNYYWEWTPDFELMSNQIKWAGKPFVVTEFYAKGMDVWEKDNSVTNIEGAGWSVKTQDDRGKFYQNFALALLESKGCVGFDWFRYIDDSSNKGIVDKNGEEYTDLTKYMEELNNQKYNLIKFFDAR